MADTVASRATAERRISSSLIEGTLQAWCNWLATEDLKSSGREIMRVRVPPLAQTDNGKGTAK